MINLNDIRNEIANLDKQIYELKCIRDRLKAIVNNADNKMYEKYIPIIDTYLNEQLNKSKQNELWIKLDRNKISLVLNNLKDIYSYKYVKADDWNNLIISKIESKPFGKVRS